MIMKFREQQTGHSKHHKPLLHILTSDEPINNIQNFFNVALAGREKVEFARAELELKKAVGLMASMTGGNANSLPFLSALSLPSMTTAITWTASAIISVDNPKTDIEPEKRNRDSLHLLHGLNKVDLTSWYENLVDKIHISSLPSEIKFLPGHPIPGKLYRQHPLEVRSDYYYPIDSYYFLLFDEREAELIQILSELGATKIVIQKESPGGGATAAKALEFDNVDGQEQFKSGTSVFEYIGKSWSPQMDFDASRYIWLEYETMWKAVVDGRIRNGCLSASFEVNIDFSDTIAGKIEGIEGLIDEMESIHSFDLEELLERALHKRRVLVKFAGE
jgi:hypothetical protein